MEVYYIHTHITPILTYLRSSLKSSLRKLPNSKAIQKMTSLRSGGKMGLMKKLSLYIFLVLMWCNVGFAEITIFECEIYSDNLKGMAKSDKQKFSGKKISLTIDSETKIITNNFPDILNDDPRITYNWVDPLGGSLSSDTNYTFNNAQLSDAGTYQIEIDFFLHHNF